MISYHMENMQCIGLQCTICIVHCTMNTLTDRHVYINFHKECK